MNNACTSLMFCGSASGEVLSPYVACKAQHISKNWIGGGLEGACYSCIFLEAHMEENSPWAENSSKRRGHCQNPYFQEGGSKSENHSSEMETSDDDDNISENNSGQFETFVSSVKGSLKVSHIVLARYSVAGTSKSKIFWDLFY